MRRGARGDRPTGRQHRPRRRPDSRRQRRRDRAVAGSHEADTRDRPADRYDDGRSWPHASGSAGGGRPRRPAVPALARFRGGLHDRRQPCLQRGRHGRAGVRQCARADGRRRGRAGGRTHRQCAVEAAQGQHWLRSEGFVCRLGGHARHHHRGGAETVSKAALARHRLHRPRNPRGCARPVPPGARKTGAKCRQLRVDEAHRGAIRARSRRERARSLPGDPPLVRALGGGGASRERTRRSRRGRARRRPGARARLRTPRSPRRSNSATISGACAN